VSEFQIALFFKQTNSQAKFPHWNE